jgi:hypothetical protein
MVAGLHVKQGRQLEHVLRDSIKRLARSERLESTYRWKAARHGRALIHEVTIPTVRGQGKLFIASGEDAVFLASNGPLLREALDSFSQSTRYATAPLQLDMTLDGIFGIYVLGSLAEKNEKLAENLGEYLVSGGGDRIESFLAEAFTPKHWKTMKSSFYAPFAKDKIENLRLRLVVQGDDALHFRLEASTLFLKWVRE